MRYRNCLFLALAIILSSSIVSAVGLSGVNLNRYEEYVPGGRYDFGYTIVSNKLYDNSYTVFAQKDLAEHVTFSQARFENIKKGSLIPFSGYVAFPVEPDHPGWHHVYICVVEDCPGGGTVCGRASSCAQLNFMALYPGIMPNVGLSTPNVNQDRPVNMEVHIENIGQEDIAQASGYVEVYNQKKEKLGRALLDSKPVKSSEKETLKGVFETKGLLPGNYSATAFLDLDGLKKQANSSFRIGTLDVRIKWFTKELETGGIKRFIVRVESAWNDPLDAYAEIELIDSAGGKGTSAKTVTNRLLPWTTLDLEAFVDTAGLEEKEYDIRITTRYASEKTVMEGKIKLVAPEEKAPEEKAAVEEEKPEKTGISSTTLTLLLVIVVILLTGVNVFLAIYRKKRS
jgi:hypothetical protein